MELLWTPSSIPPVREDGSVAILPAAALQCHPPAGAHDELDSVTLERAMRGERTALEAFVKHYERRLFAFLSRTMGRDPAVEDVAQDVFLRALRALPRFEPGRAKLSSWLFQIAIHRLRDEFRRRRPTEEICPDTAASRFCSPEAGVDEREALHWLQHEVEELPEDQRVALVLFEFHDLSLHEISEVTGASEATVKTRVFRAKKKLIEAYRKHSQINLGGGT